jgi:hypothetical protein
LRFLNEIVEERDNIDFENFCVGLVYEILLLFIDWSNFSFNRSDKFVQESELDLMKSERLRSEVWVAELSDS